MRRLLLALLLIPVVAQSGGGDSSVKFVRIPAGEYKSALRYEDGDGRTRVAAFEIMKRPVTNAEYLAFVKANPEWRRGRAPAVFAEPQHYLSHWKGPLELGVGNLSTQPVTQVSWFAATAYCETLHARLPTWAEWEYVAASDEKRRDARADPAWRERILSWYSKPANTEMSPVAQAPANVYGVQDMHGLVWEWAEDYAAMMVSADNREQKAEDRLKFCGAGAIALDDRENYAVLMRVAMLSALEADDSTSSLGFRCARSLPQGKP